MIVTPIIPDSIAASIIRTGRLSRLQRRVGLVCCFVVALGMAYMGDWSLVYFSPPRGIVSMQFWSCGMLLVWSLIFVPILVPLYAYGSNLYECGSPSSKITIAYLEDAPEIQWCVAVIATVFAFVTVSSVMLFREKAKLEYPEHKFFQAGHCMSTAVVRVAWLVMLAPLATFPAMVS